MKNLVHLLRASTRWAITHDDDAVAGVYAVPGPRAQGDEAASDPPLTATLLDEVRSSGIHAGLLDEMLDGASHSQGTGTLEGLSLHVSEDPGDEPPPDGKLN